MTVDDTDVPGPPGLLTMAEVVAALRVSRRTVNRLIAAGVLDVRWHGNRKLAVASTVHAYLNSPERAQRPDTRPEEHTP